jgi:glycerol kinase
MKNKRFIMSIDQGTTGTRVILFDHDGEVRGSSYQEIKQFYPEPGWVEHDPVEIIKTVNDCSEDVLKNTGVDPEEITAIGITNQRETTVLWDRESGKPLYNAIVWQCRRSAEICDSLKEQGFENMVRKKTGLFIDAYFSATKIKWLLDNVPSVSDKMKAGQVCMGNIDSWIIWNLSGGKHHVTDFSNASRTMLLNIHDLDWDDELLEILGINRNILPALAQNSGLMAETDPSVFPGGKIPVTGAAGDQQAALFGQGCFHAGMTKNTYGTALALLINTGAKSPLSNNGLTTDLAWVLNGEVTYALEGLIFIGGATIQWLRDGLKIINEPKEADILSEKVPDTGNVYLVPAFTGLSAPYWDMYARGTLIGITRGTGREHICRAAEEAIAYQTRDVIDAMIADSKEKLTSLRVDGGATKSDFLMQFQADILGIPVEKPVVTEMSALGAAYLAGLGVGFWNGFEDLNKHWKIDKIYEPAMSEDKREELYSGWKKAVKRSLGWAKQE